jgi:hypothetical protein
VVTLDVQDGTVEVTTDRFLIVSGGHDHDPRPFITAVFTILTHTPIEAIALEWAWHVRFESAQLTTTFYEVILGGTNWSPLLGDEQQRGFWAEGTRNDGLEGTVRLEIEDLDDAAKAEQSSHSIRLTVADNVDTDSDSGASDALEKLERVWAQSRVRAVETTDAIISSWRQADE